MAITSFSIDQLDRMTLTDEAAIVMSAPGAREALMHLTEADLTATLVSPDGKLLGVMGAVPTVPGVCEVFVVATKDQAKYPVAFARSVRRALYTLKNKYRRIQAVSKEGAALAGWLEWLGFEREGVLRKYGKEGEDMVMWGLI